MDVTIQNRSGRASPKTPTQPPLRAAEEFRWEDIFAEHRVLPSFQSAFKYLGTPVEGARAFCKNANIEDEEEKLYFFDCLDAETELSKADYNIFWKQLSDWWRLVEPEKDQRRRLRRHQRKQHQQLEARDTLDGVTTQTFNYLKETHAEDHETNTTHCARPLLLESAEEDAPRLATPPPSVGDAQFKGLPTTTTCGPNMPLAAPAISAVASSDGGSVSGISTCCNSCKKLLPVENFYPSKRSMCKDCWKVRSQLQRKQKKRRPASRVSKKLLDCWKRTGRRQKKRPRENALLPRATFKKHRPPPLDVAASEGQPISLAPSKFQSNIGRNYRFRIAGGTCTCKVLDYDCATNTVRLKGYNESVGEKTCTLQEFRRLEANPTFMWVDEDDDATEDEEDTYFFEADRGPEGSGLPVTSNC